jgi:large subunit ribosomal protein L29
VKGLQAKNLRGNDREELQRTLNKLRGDLFQHRLKRSTNQLENTMLIRTARREIARVLTVLGADARGVHPASTAAPATAAATEAAETAAAPAAEKKAAKKPAAKKKSTKAKEK